MIKDYIAFDLETTGLDVCSNEIIEIGAVKVVQGKVVDRFIEFLKPEQPISAQITQITGITNEMVERAKDTEKVVRAFVNFCEDLTLVGHNIMFDYRLSKKYANQYGYSFEKKGIDTLKIARKVHKDFESKSLGALCSHYGICNPAAHRAYHDALATAKVYQSMAHYYESGQERLFVPEQLMFKEKKMQPITAKQMKFLETLCIENHLPIPCDMERMTRSEASKKIDGIISQYGGMRR